MSAGVAVRSRTIHRAYLALEAGPVPGGSTPLGREYCLSNSSVSYWPRRQNSAGGTRRYPESMVVPLPDMVHNKCQVRAAIRLELSAMANGTNGTGVRVA